MTPEQLTELCFALVLVSPIVLLGLVTYLLGLVWYGRQWW